MAQLLGTGGHQAPTNSELGGMAQQNPDNVNISGGIVDATLTQSYDFTESTPLVYLDFTQRRLDHRLRFWRWSRATYFDGKTTATAECNLCANSQDIVSGTHASGINTVGSNSAAGGPWYPWYWSNMSGAGNHNGTTAPDGLYTASLLLETSATGYHYVQHQLNRSATTNQPGYYTVSVFVKNYSGGRHLRISCGYDGDNYSCITVRTSDGAITGAVNSSAHNGASGATQLVGSPGSTNTSHVSGGVTGVGNGWYRVYLTFYGWTDSVFFSLNASADPPRTSTWGMESYAGTTSYGVWLWGCQIEPRAYLTDYVKTGYMPVKNTFMQLMIADLHQPRFGYDPITGEALGLLCEEGAWNYCTYSEDISQAVWSRSNINYTNNAMMAPIGTYTAQLVYDTGGSAVRYVSPENFQARTDNLERVCSVFVKPRIIGATYDSVPCKKRYFWMGLVSSSGNFWGFYIFDLENLKMTCVRSRRDTDDNPGMYYFDAGADVHGSWGEDGKTNKFYGMQEIGGGWVRVHAYMYHVVSGSGETAAWRFGMTDKAVAENYNDLAYTGDSYSGIYMWGFQIEGVKGNRKPTSYIRTLGTSTYVPPDRATLDYPGYGRDNREYDGGPFSLYFEGSQPTDGDCMMISWYNGFEGSYLYYTGGGLVMQIGRAYVYFPNANYNERMMASTDRNPNRLTWKFAVALKNNDCAAVMDAGEENPIVRQRRFAVVVGFKNIGIAHWDFEGATNWEGGVKKIIIYPGRMSNVELLERVN